MFDIQEMKKHRGFGCQFCSGTYVQHFFLLSIIEPRSEKITSIYVTTHLTSQNWQAHPSETHNTLGSSEYLATFKKTVAMHEVFLTRLASHSVFREDPHLNVFLEFDQDLCARPKGRLQQLGGYVKSLGSTTDQYYLGATVRDVNDFFEQQLNSITEYHANLKEATQRSDRMSEKHKGTKRNC